MKHPNLRSLTPKEIEAELSGSKAALEGLGFTIKNMVYPYNKSNASVREITSRYYRSGRGGTNTFNAGIVDPYFLKSFSMKHDIAGMKKLIDSAYEKKYWLIFYQHEIDAQVKLSEKQGSFAKGEMLKLSPSGTIARYVTVHWFPVYGFSLYLVPLSGLPQEGDLITGTVSGATARVDHVIYNELVQLSEMIQYIHTTHPDLQIVTIDQGLDRLGIPERKTVQENVRFERAHNEL